MLAHQVAGKAVRDSFFLTNYPASELPKMVIAVWIIHRGVKSPRRFALISSAINTRPSNREHDEET